MQEKEIRAVYDAETVRVYQAYHRVIAEEAVRLGTFGPHFSMNRMTWIKPSFLWMMYHCGWAEKENQEHVLAIDIRRTGFDSAVRQAVASSYRPECGMTKEQCQAAVQHSDVRVQWDPEKDVSGQDLPYRSIQLGLRGKAVQDYVQDWIVRITDISEQVRALNLRRKAGEDISALLPRELPYQPKG